MNVVETKSAWLSKINITSFVAALIALAAASGWVISEELSKQILTVTGIVGPMVIVVLRTWFTSTVTPSVAANL